MKSKPDDNKTDWEYVFSDDSVMTLKRHAARTVDMQAGFVEIQMSASYEVASDPESLRLGVQMHLDHITSRDFIERVTKSGLAKVKELDEMKESFQTWSEIPGVFAANAHCEVVGRKPE